MKTFKILALFILTTATSALLFTTCNCGGKGGVPENFSINHGHEDITLGTGDIKCIEVIPPDINITWTVEPAGLVKISDNCIEAGDNPGQGTLIGELESGETIELQVHVSKVFHKFEIEADDCIILPLGETQTLLVFEDLFPKSPAYTGQVKWALDPAQSDVVTLTPSGTKTASIKALKPGRVIITATSTEDTAANVHDSVEIIVQPKAWFTNTQGIGLDTVSEGKVLNVDNSAFGKFNFSMTNTRGTSNVDGQWFSFAYLPVKGDFTMIVKVDSIHFTIQDGTSGVAGLIAIPQTGITRNTSNGALTNVPQQTNLLYASVLLRPAGGSGGVNTTRHFIFRTRNKAGIHTVTGTSSSNNPYSYKHMRIGTATAADGTSGLTSAGGRWMKLSRQGNTFTAWYSIDKGVSWVKDPLAQVSATDKYPFIGGDETVIMGSDIYVGIWVAGGTAPGTHTTTAGFSKWSIVSGKHDADITELEKLENNINLSGLK